MTTERNKGDKAVIENATVRGAFLNQDKNGKPWIRFLLEDTANPTGDSIDAKAWGDTVNLLMNRPDINDIQDYKGKKITFKAEWSDFGGGAWTIKSLPTQQPDADDDSTEENKAGNAAGNSTDNPFDHNFDRRADIDFGQALNLSTEIACFKAGALGSKEKMEEHFKPDQFVTEMKAYLVPLFNCIQETRPVLVESLKKKILAEIEENKEEEPITETLPDGTEAPW